MKKMMILTLCLSTLPSISLSCSKTKVTSVNNNSDVTTEVDESTFTSLGKFKLPNTDEPFNVETEGLYILKDSFDGILWEGKINNGKISDSQITLASGGITQLGKNDKLYMLYNDNDEDGISPKDIIKQLTFNDTSMIDKNKDAFFIGNNEKGQLKNWGVSQNNHMNMTFNEAVTKLKAQISQDEFTRIAQYYGFLPEPVNGIFVNDTSNNSSKSREFVPVYGGDNFFSYKRTHQNAFELTFNNDNDVNISSAIFKIKNLLTNKYQLSGQFALGNAYEWKAYELSRDLKYNFITRKKPMYKYVNDKLFNITWPNEKTWPLITNSSVWSNLLIDDNNFATEKIDIISDESSYKVTFRENDVIRYVLEANVNDDSYNRFDFYEVKNNKFHKNVEQVYWNSSVPIP